MLAISLQVAKLDTLANVEEFLNRTELDYHGKPINTIKIIGTFYDLEETEEDIKEFKRAAELLFDRTEVYLGMVYTFPPFYSIFAEDHQQKRDKKA